MVPPPGYSAGDFYQLIKLTVKIVKALRESRESSTEIQRVIQDLIYLQQILEFIQDLRPAGASISHVNGIRGLALTCLGPLEEFDEKFRDRYGLIASEEISRLSLRQGSKQIRWAFSGTEDLSKFRSTIGAKVASLGLLLDCFQIQSLSRIEADQEKVRKELLEQWRQSQDALQQNISTEATSNHAVLSNLITESYGKLRNEISCRKTEAQSYHEIVFQNSDRHVQEMLDLTSQVFRSQQDMRHILEDFRGLINEKALDTQGAIMSVNTKMEELEGEMRLMQRKQDLISLPIPTTLVSMLGRLKIFCIVGASVLSNLIPFSKRSLSYLRAGIGTSLKLHALFRETQESVPTSPGVSGSIYFEDVLGRSHSLPYTYFQHWDVFEAMLRCEFRGLPGERQILRGEYILESEGVTTHEIKKEDWLQQVGTTRRLAMSVRVQMPFTQDGVCPKPSCNTLVEKTPGWGSVVTSCSNCGFTFIPYSLQHRFTGPHSTRRGESSRPHRYSREEVDTTIQYQLETWERLPGAGKDRIFQNQLRERRARRLLQRSSEIEQDSQEMQAFRRVHVMFDPLEFKEDPFLEREPRNQVARPNSTRIIRFRRRWKYPPVMRRLRSFSSQDDMRKLETFFQQLMYGDADRYDMSFEGLYFSAYGILLEGHGQILYDRISFCLEAYIKDLVEEVLPETLKGSEYMSSHDVFDEKTLHKISLMLQGLIFTVSQIQDVLMYMEKSYIQSENLLDISGLGRATFRNLITEEAFADLKRKVETTAASSDLHNRADLEICLNMISLLEGDVR